MVTLDDLNALTNGSLPGMFGIKITRLNGTQLASSLTIQAEFMAPNGYLHAATVVALADTACGFGTIANLPQGARGFTTIELKTNFLGTAQQGTILCEASLVHGGRTTQVWDAQVIHEATGKTIAIFRCTQMILYPRKD
jgi:uncharacterized protein (TIGR00369 family)